jgi:hypothetical protein
MGADGHRKTCSRTGCGDIVTGSHVWNTETAVITPPTCTKGGYTTYTCVCSEKLVSDVVESSGHSEAIVEAVASTCMKTGLTEGKICTSCEQVLVEQKETPVLGHDMKQTAEAVGPSCEGIGRTAVYTCANQCGRTEGGEPIPATGHDFHAVFDWQSNFSGVDATVACGVCQDSNTVRCELSCVWNSADRNMEVTATVRYEDKTFTDVQKLKLNFSGNQLTITNSAAQEDEHVDMCILVAGYIDGKLNDCQIIENVNGVISENITVAGDREVFFLRPGTYEPLLPCVKL